MVWAGIYFLLSGRGRHTWAIIRAHGGFYRAWGRGELRRERFLPFLPRRVLRGLTRTPTLLKLIRAVRKACV